VEAYNLRILSVFHYGFDESQFWIREGEHYYPPLVIEDRFSQIVIPLLNSISSQYHVSAVPDLISFTSSYWGIRRLGIEALDRKQRLLNEGHAESEDMVKILGTWEQLNDQARSFAKRRIKQILMRIAIEWPMTHSDRTSVQPKILFSNFACFVLSFYFEWLIQSHDAGQLHHIDSLDKVPNNKIKSLNDIGLYVVEQLITEGRSAMRGEKTWTEWIKQFKSNDVRSDVLLAGLGSRLAVDDWASKILVSRRFIPTPRLT
jgi:hypothetical protein